MSCGRSGSGNSFVAGQEVAGNAGTGYSSDSGGSAFDGRICIFCPPESEQHCDYFII